MFLNRSINRQGLSRRAVLCRRIGITTRGGEFCIADSLVSDRYSESVSTKRSIFTGYRLKHLSIANLLGPTIVACQVLELQVVIRRAAHSVLNKLSILFVWWVTYKSKHLGSRQQCKDCRRNIGGWSAIARSGWVFIRQPSLTCSMMRQQ